MLLPRGENCHFQNGATRQRHRNCYPRTTAKRVEAPPDRPCTVGVLAWALSHADSRLAAGNHFHRLTETRRRSQTNGGKTNFNWEFVLNSLTKEFGVLYQIRRGTSGNVLVFIHCSGTELRVMVSVMMNPSPGLLSLLICLTSTSRTWCQLPEDLMCQTFPGLGSFHS